MSTQAKISAGLAVWLSLTAVVLTTVVAPPLAQAYTARVNVAIDRQGDESYEALLQRAELVARAAAQRSFDRDILINDVAIMIIAQSQGVEVPILSVEVSRQQWRSRPDAHRWATYYKTAKTLLQLDNVAGPRSFPRSASPSVPPRVVPAAPPVTPAPQPQSPLPPGTPAPGRSNGGTATPNQPAPTPGTTTPAQPGTATPTQPGRATPNQPRNPNVPPEDQTDDEF
jgi:hypothetical protein